MPGNETIELSRSSSRVVYARAMGPMQFLPGTWSRYASDGNGDGKADVQNVFDSTLAAARYLCSGGLNLRDQSQVMTAILRYNNSVAYAQNVLGWAAAYATGVVPVDLPPITGPIPPIADVHLDNYQGLGPGSPLNVLGLPANDPLSVVPLFDLGRTDVASQMANGPTFGPLPGPAEAVPPMMTAAGTGTEPAALDAASAVDAAAVDAAAAAAAAAELRGVLHRHQPTGPGAAAAAARGTAAGCLALRRRTARDRATPDGRNRATAGPARRRLHRSPGPLGPQGVGPAPGPAA